MASREIHQHKVRRENWLEDHPKFKEIQSYGYYDDKASMARAAITVYLDLCESKHWFGVCIRPCESMKIVYITGKRTKKSQMEAVVPLTIDTAMTTEEIQNVLQEVNRCEEESKDVKCEKIQTSKVVIGFCEADSTVVYYDFYQGLVPPDPPDEEEEHEEEEDVKPKRKQARQKKAKPN